MWWPIDISDGSLLDFLRQVSTFGHLLIRLVFCQAQESYRNTVDHTENGQRNAGRNGSYPSLVEIAFFSDTISLRQKKLLMFWKLSMSFQNFPQTTSVPITSQWQNPCLMCLLSSFYNVNVTWSSPLRVVPLFIKLADLEPALAAVTRLFYIDWLQQPINGKQEVMIGYSDA